MKKLFEIYELMNNCISGVKMDRKKWIHFITFICIGISIVSFFNYREDIGKFYLALCLAVVGIVTIGMTLVGRSTYLSIEKSESSDIPQVKLNEQPLTVIFISINIFFFSCYLISSYRLDADHANSVFYFLSNLVSANINSPSDKHFFQGIVLIHFFYVGLTIVDVSLKAASGAIRAGNGRSSGNETGGFTPPDGGAGGRRDSDNKDLDLKIVKILSEIEKIRSDQSIFWGDNKNDFERSDELKSDLIKDLKEAGIESDLINDISFILKILSVRFEPRMNYVLIIEVIQILRKILLNKNMNHYG